MNTKNLIIFSIFLIAVGYLVFKMFIEPKMVVNRAKRYLKKGSQNRIDNISKSDFTIYLNGVPRNVKWNDVRSIEFVSKDYLVVALNNDDEIDIKPDCVGRLEFIKQVPNGINGFDYDYVANYFKSLKSCPICGLYSVEVEECLNCYYSEELKEEYGKDMSEDEFYKEQQLDYFTVYFDENESVEQTLSKARQSKLFEVDRNWKVYPSKAEILKAKEEMK